MMTGDVSTLARADRLPAWKSSTYQGLVLLTIAVLAIVGGCRPAPPASERFTPPYLRLDLCAGKAAVRPSDATEWQDVTGEVLVEESVHLRADASMGARFCIGDDSTLELSPAAQVALRNPRILPRLQIELEEGRLQFVAQKPSYAFLLDGCSLTVASVPSQLTIEMTNEDAHLMVDRGALTCVSDAGTLTLVRCQDLRASDGMTPQIGQFCETTAVPTVAAPSPTPSATPRAAEPTATATTTPSPTATATPRAQLPRPTDTLAPPTPTETPTAPPPPPPPPATSPPQPRPTNPPAPPPTDTPVPPPPDTPPPPPTDTPRPPPTLPPPTDTPRPTPTPSDRERWVYPPDRSSSDGILE